jgi:rRNA maturation endonuclease Nob1
MKTTTITAFTLLLIAYMSFCMAWEKVITKPDFKKCPLCGQTIK